MDQYIFLILKNSHIKLRNYDEKNIILEAISYYFMETSYETGYK